MDIEKHRKNTLIFAVNGERYELSFIDPSTTVLEFLRIHTPFKSAKLSCGEGGCGACTVLLSKYNPVLDRVEDCTISSCLTLLCSINGCSITTSEGLGNSKDGFHPIHKRFAGFHASQCGFCTPGMCMSLFGALVNVEKTSRSEPASGFSKLTVLEAEKAISGNLCRCTGYRPIADVCKSFAGDVDMEDLGYNSFWTKGEKQDVKVSRLPCYDRNIEICAFPEFLKREVKLENSSLFDSGNRCSWYRPSSIQQLQSLLNTTYANGVRTKLVVGNTGTGYYKESEKYDKYIDLKYIPELSIIRRDTNGIEIGATVTVSKVIEALKEECDMVYQKIADHLDKVATPFVRNTGSIGGNLTMAQRRNFPSDITTILLAAGAFVDILSNAQGEKLTLEEFLERQPLNSDSVLQSVKIPNCRSKKDANPDKNSRLLFETYRASPRPLGNALPYLSAAFQAEISESKLSGGIVLNCCRLVFGSFRTKHAIRARKVEEYLTGKVLNIVVLYEAVKLVLGTVVPQDGTRNPAYRSSLAVGFLFDFLSQLTDISSNGSLDNCKGIGELKSNELPGLLSSSKQEIQLNKEYHPVGEPITKSGASLQASGEAVYVDDIPCPINCLHGAFIYSTKPFARVKSIGLDSKSLADGVTALLSSKDIPKGGANIGASFSFGIEPLFAEEYALYAGHTLAFVLADTQKHADAASNLAVVEYDFENLEPPILTVEEAVKRSSFFEIPSFMCPKQVGDVSKGMAEADHKILSAEIKLGSQYQFYMENQTALAVPDEDNCMVVYSSTQAAEKSHVSIAKCLGVPENNVRVITRRVGGGFGGKEMRAMCVATACALAAQKLRRPVRTYVSLKTDMIMSGGRHPMKVTYSVGFKSNGKVTALHLQILINAGIFIDVTPIIPINLLGSLKKYNWGALSFDIKACKTNLSSKAAMRAPGGVQGTYIAEAIIEHIASYLSMDPDSVRSINFHTHDSLKLFYDISAGESVEYSLPSIWTKLAVSSSILERNESIKEFNKLNLWKKRGISRIPVVYVVTVRPTPGKVSILSDGSIVVEVGGIELGQGLWTKVKQTTAFALSLIKCEGDLLDKVRVIQSDTLSLTQGGCTVGSTTSESSSEAVRLCCKVLVERLIPIRDRLQAQAGSINWDMLISQAYSESVSLSANSYFVPDSASIQYLNYGAAVSEVEIDLLTGQTTILRSDIVYDCGQSLNPAVDLGQIEGAFVQGIGFFMFEEHTTNLGGLADSKGTWTYKIPTIDTIPKQLNIEILNTGHHQQRILSSKASGEPPLLLAASVHCAIRMAIREARKQIDSWGSTESSNSTFDVDVPATMPKVKKLCGLDVVEKYLLWKMGSK